MTKTGHSLIHASALETGLVYYGYRYYDTELGRWVNRDPINEIGHKLIKNNYSVSSFENQVGDFYIDDSSMDEVLYNLWMIGHDNNDKNLYHYVFNNSINDYDILGENPYVWRVAVAVVRGVAKWVIKRGGKMAKDQAKRELSKKKKQVAVCAALHTQYKRTEKNCRACNTQTPSAHNEANCVCWSAAVAGRSMYIKKKCDYIWPDAVARGSRRAEAEHKAELANKIRAQATCSGLCL